MRVTNEIEFLFFQNREENGWCLLLIILLLLLLLIKSLQACRSIGTQQPKDTSLSLLGPNNTGNERQLAAQ